MPRFYYEYVELELGADDEEPGDDPVPREWTYVVYDRRFGDHEFARCDRCDDAEKIVEALNAHKPPSLGVFG